jgi:hypothetical protein
VKALEQVLADWLENAQAARRIDQPHDAELIERVIREVQEATEDYRHELSEEAAMNRSGRTREWLRARWREWQLDGHAWRRGRKRYYRAVIVPRRVNVEQIQQDAKDAAA